MNRKVLKAVSALLAVSVVLPFAACGRKKSDYKEKRSGKKITADTPWYDCSSYVVDAPVDKSRKLDQLEMCLLSCDEKRILVWSGGLYGFQGNGDFDPDTSFERFEIITVIDRATSSTIRTIDLLKFLKEDERFETVTASGSQIKIRYRSIMDTGSGYYVKTIDADTGNESGQDQYMQDTNANIQMFHLGSCDIQTEFFSVPDTEDCGYHLLVSGSDGNSRTAELVEADHEINHLRFIVLENETTALISATTDSKDSFYKLDLGSLAITRADPKDYTWLNEYISNFDYSNEAGPLYSMKKTGIYKLDFAQKKAVEAFNYSYCGINTDSLAGSELAYLGNDSAVFTSRPSTYGVFDDDIEPVRFEVFDFKKAGKNPHEGKTILEMYAGDYMISPVIGDAVLEFNAKNGKYFIEITDRFDQSDAELSSASSVDEAYKAELSLNAKKSSYLASAIAGGDGPDILLDTSALAQLSSDRYLADLTPYIGTPDQSRYFNNIIDCYKVDGKIYNLPVEFSIYGIQTRHDIDSFSNIGFTTSEYKEFLNKTLNGRDVISNGQACYFARLFNAMREKFIVDGKADFTVPEFAELARFVKDNVHEKSDTNNDYEGYTFFDANTYMAFGTRDLYLYGTGSYFYYMVELGSAERVMGIPSTDGRGPLVSANSSVAVSAHATDIDACGEFVKLLLSDDIQFKLAKTSSFTLNRQAFRESSKAEVDFANTDNFYRNFPGMDVIHYHITFSEKNIDDMEKIILSCTHSKSEDGAVSIILIEEMPAYFLGQKDLDAVIKTAQSRAQKVLDERE